MSRSFEGLIERLSEQSGYPYDYLVDRWEEMLNELGDIDWDEFTEITLTHDWE